MCFRATEISIVVLVPKSVFTGSKFEESSVLELKEGLFEQIYCEL